MSASPPPQPSSLAALLTESYHDSENLRRELAQLRKRAEKAERLAASLQALHSESSPPNNSSTSTPFPESATRILMDFEDRAVRAEVARDEAEARKRVLMDTWSQLESYLAAISDATADARAGYSRIVSEGGGQLVLRPIPTLSRPTAPRAGILGTPVFPPAAPNNNRRPRSPSIDTIDAYPPSKKSRADVYHYPDPHAPQHTYPPPPRLVYRPPRMILPPQHHRSHNPRSPPSPHPRSHSRSSSSDTSMSVDEMLLQATTEENASSGVTLNGNIDHLQQQLAVPRQRTSKRRSNSAMSHVQDPPPPPPPQQQQQQQQHIYPHTYTHPHPHPHSAPSTRPSSYRKLPNSSTESTNGEFQTHIFAPPVTGAPTKKSKFTEPPAPPPHGAGQPAPGVSFPPVNDQGQRICRQCGVAGRYKDEKCVEKWGPGPLGPGTVCDRCRKKMKRVERRGTLDTQQLRGGGTVTTSTPTPTPTPTLHHTPSSNHSPNHGTHPRSRAAVHRTDTLPARTHTQHTYPSSTSTPNSSSAKPDVPYNTPPPPPKSMRTTIDDEIPISEVRGSEGVSKKKAAAAAAAAAGVLVETNGNGNRYSNSTKSDGDVDAELEAEAGDVEAEAEVIEAEEESGVSKTRNGRDTAGGDAETVEDTVDDEHES